MDADGSAQLLEALRQWRNRKARAAGVPAHIIINDQTLRVVADQTPTTAAKLGAVPGMSAVKLQRYGEEILAVLGAE